MRASSRQRTFLTVLGLALGWGVVADADYRLVDLGAVVADGSLVVNAMNASGQLVGTVTSGNVSHAYTRGIGGAGGSVTVPSYVTSSTGLNINAQGDITGSFADHRDGDQIHAFRIVNGAFEDLGTLLNGSGIGTAIDSVGNVAGYGLLPGGIQRAFGAFGGGAPTMIAPLSGGLSNAATGVNALGTVVGTSDVGNRVSRAFVATSDGKVSDLLDLHPGSAFKGSTFATAINDQGTIIGYGTLGTGSHAFLAPTSGALIDLGIASGAQTSMAVALNSRNQVVGSLGFGGGASHAFFWDSTTRMIDLNTVLTASEQSSWVLTQAMAIGESGDITGIGYKDGQLHAFLLQSIPINPSIVPEPPAWALTTLGVLLAAGFKLGQKRGRDAA